MAVTSGVDDSAGGSGTAPERAPVWMRPHSLGYHEALRGLGGIVAPLLAGFSLAAIATIVTSSQAPRLAEWAVAALGAAVALLLLSMQVAFLSLTQNSSPEVILSWRPETTVSKEELDRARAAQAADLLEMTRLGRLSFGAYGAGIVAFLLGLVLLMVPQTWSAGWVIGVAATSAALLLEVWWLVANHVARVPHPVSREVEPSHGASWEGPPPPLDAVGLASVLDPKRQ
jgi:hypothetical protein